MSSQGQSTAIAAENRSRASSTSPASPSIKPPQAVTSPPPPAKTDPGVELLVGEPGRTPAELSEMGVLPVASPSTNFLNEAALERTKFLLSYTRPAVEHDFVRFTVLQHRHVGMVLASLIVILATLGFVLSADSMGLKDSMGLLIAVGLTVLISALCALGELILQLAMAKRQMAHRRADYVDTLRLMLVVCLAILSHFVDVYGVNACVGRQRYDPDATPAPPQAPDLFPTKAPATDDPVKLVDERCRFRISPYPIAALAAPLLLHLPRFHTWPAVIVSHVLGFIVSRVIIASQGDMYDNDAWVGKGIFYAVAIAIITILKYYQENEDRRFFETVAVYECAAARLKRRQLVIREAAGIALPVQLANHVLDGNALDLMSPFASIALVELTDAPTRAASGDADSAVKSVLSAHRAVRRIAYKLKLEVLAQQLGDTIILGANFLDTNPHHARSVAHFGIEAVTHIFNEHQGLLRVAMHTGRITGSVSYELGLHLDVCGEAVEVARTVLLQTHSRSAKATAVTAAMYRTGIGGDESALLATYNGTEIGNAMLPSGSRRSSLMQQVHSPHSPHSPHSLPSHSGGEQNATPLPRVERSSSVTSSVASPRVPGLNGSGAGSMRSPPIVGITSPSHRGSFAESQATAAGRNIPSAKVVIEDEPSDSVFLKDGSEVEVFEIKSATLPPKMQLSSSQLVSLGSGSGSQGFMRRSSRLSELQQQQQQQQAEVKAGVLPVALQSPHLQAQQQQYGSPLGTTSHLSDSLNSPKEAAASNPMNAFLGLIQQRGEGVDEDSAQVDEQHHDADDREPPPPGEENNTSGDDEETPNGTDETATMRQLEDTRIEIQEEETPTTSPSATADTSEMVGGRLIVDPPSGVQERPFGSPGEPADATSLSSMQGHVKKLEHKSPSPLLLGRSPRRVSIQTDAQRSGNGSESGVLSINGLPPAAAERPFRTPPVPLSSTLNVFTSGIAGSASFRTKDDDIEAFDNTVNSLMRATLRQNTLSAVEMSERSKDGDKRILGNFVRTLALQKEESSVEEGEAADPMALVAPGVIAKHHLEWRVLGKLLSVCRFEDPETQATFITWFSSEMQRPFAFVVACHAVIAVYGVGVLQGEESSDTKGWDSMTGVVVIAVVCAALAVLLNSISSVSFARASLVPKTMTPLLWITMAAVLSVARPSLLGNDVAYSVIMGACLSFASTLSVPYFVLVRLFSDVVVTGFHFVNAPTFSFELAFLPICFVAAIGTTSRINGQAARQFLGSRIHDAVLDDVIQEEDVIGWLNKVTIPALLPLKPLPATRMPISTVVHMLIHPSSPVIVNSNEPDSPQMTFAPAVPSASHHAEALDKVLAEVANLLCPVQFVGDAVTILGPFGEDGVVGDDSQGESQHLHPSSAPGHHVNPLMSILPHLDDGMNNNSRSAAVSGLPHEMAIAGAVRFVSQLSKRSPNIGFSAGIAIGETVLAVKYRSDIYTFIAVGSAPMQARALAAAAPDSCVLITGTAIDHGGAPVDAALRDEELDIGEMTEWDMKAMPPMLVAPLGPAQIGSTSML